MFRVVWKEIRVAVLCGVCLAAACFAKVMLVDHLLMHNESVTTTVALVVCISMALTVFMAKLVGSTLPLLAKRSASTRPSWPRRSSTIVDFCRCSSISRFDGALRIG